jgi:SAM-dependent methyltransferase
MATIRTSAPSDCLGAVQQQAATPAERIYFALHRPRYEFVLREVATVAAGRPLRILDVGCYPYHVGAALEMLGHEVYGVSSSHEPLARENVAIVNVERDPLPYASDFFDLVIFNEIIEHLPQSPVPALRELHRVTRAGGNMILTTPNIARVNNRIKLLLGQTIMYPVDVYFEEGGLGNNAYYRHNREYTRSELARLVAGASWQVQEQRYITVLTPFRERAPGEPTSGLGRALQMLGYPVKIIIPALRDTLYILARKNPPPVARDNGIGEGQTPAARSGR